MKYTIVIFIFAAINVPLALLEGNQMAIFNWISFGFCCGLGVASITHDYLT